MPKQNYFDTLERLSVLCSRSVFLVCTHAKSTAHSEICTIRHSADKIVCELEKTLFSDFMPPLERANIAACAHSLVRVMEKCTQISGYRASKGIFAEKKSKEAELCIRLSQLVEENISRLRKIKHPEELPDFPGFRKLISEARTTHQTMLRKMSTGIYPKNSQQLLLMMGELRSELSHCFDDIIEIMLNNI